MEKIRMAVVGYGQRGSYVTVHSLHFIDSIEVTAICDLYQDRVDKGVEENEKKYGNKVLGTLDYHDVLNSDNVDAVYVACSWEYHIEVAIEAMRKGKIVALEVGGAYSIDELHRLVRTYEDTEVCHSNGLQCIEFFMESFAIAATSFRSDHRSIPEVCADKGHCLTVSYKFTVLNLHKTSLFI